MDDAKKWQGLDAKLSEGLPLRTACSQLGIDLKDAIRWLNALRELAEHDAAAENVGIDGIRHAGVSNLVDLSYNSNDEEVRVKASLGLLAHYRDERKRLEAKAAKPSDGDGQIGLFGPWDVRKPGV